jgi:hypothetical protein
LAGSPVPLRTFAESLGVRYASVQARTTRGHRQIAQALSSGHPDEVWLKLLAIRHPNGRHSVEDWAKLIERYKQEPAHPSDPNYAPPVL